MSCKPGCGSTREIVETLIKSAIDDAINNGKLQGTLKDCGGSDLSKGQKVVLCDTLAEQVNALIEKGTIDVVAEVKIEDGKLKVTDGRGNVVETKFPGVKTIVVEDGKLKITGNDGSEQSVNLDAVSGLTFDPQSNKLKWSENGKDKEASLPYIKAVMGDKSVTLTLPDGSTVEVPKGSSALTEESFDHTIAKGANVPDKFGVKLKDKGGLKADGIGGVEVATGAGLEKDEQGNVTIKTGTGVKTNPDGSLSLDDNGAKDVVGAGLAGSGLTYDANAKTINVATIGLYDASGTVKLGELVNTGA